MTCYIYRDTERTLIGPFSSPERAFEHREEIRAEQNGRRGRPRTIGTIISAEEAINVTLRSNVTRKTPEQDVLVEKELERAA